MPTTDTTASVQVHALGLTIAFLETDARATLELGDYTATVRGGDMYEADITVRRAGETA
jgi:hypothetical protein